MSSVQLPSEKIQRELPAHLRSHLDVLKSDTASEQATMRALFEFTKSGSHAVPFLLAFLRHPSYRVRSWAALDLGHLRHFGALPQLHALLANDKSDSVRMAAATALGEIGNPASEIVLRRRLTEEERDWVKERIEAALKNMKKFKH